MKGKPKDHVGGEAEREETIERRLRELRQGAVEGIPHSQVMGELDEALTQDPRALDRLFGMLGEPPRKVTIEEMDGAIAERVRRKFLSNREEP